MSLYQGNDYAELLELSDEAPATWFQVPVAWPDPVVLVTGKECCPTYRGGFRASLFADIWRDEEQRRYSRGLCHAHAVAACQLHDGELMVMMQDDKVVHVMSAHEVDGWCVLRDVFGDRIYSDRSEIDHDEIELISELYLLGAPVTHLLWQAGDGSELPCRKPAEDELAEARQRISVTKSFHAPVPIGILPNINF